MRQIFYSQQINKGTPHVTLTHALSVKRICSSLYWLLHQTCIFSLTVKMKNSINFHTAAGKGGGGEEENLREGKLLKV